MNLTKILTASVVALSLVVVGCEQGGYDPSEPGLLVAKTVDQDPSIPSISVNGTQLHAQSFGNPNDPMLVVLHGGPGADYRYLLNCTAFADQGYYVVFYDQRGAGLSKRYNKDIYTMQVLYDDLSAVIAHYQTDPNQKIFLLGHSWGAMLATAYINNYPTKIDGVILAEPGGFVWADVEGYISRSRDFKYFGELLNDAVYMDQFITAKENDHELLDYKFDLLTAVDGDKDSPTGNEGALPFWRSGAVTFDAYLEIGEKERPDWTTNLDQFTTKILFVYSENNKAYGEAHAKKVSSAYTNVQLEKTLGAGHDMISFPTGWQNFYPVALAYLNELK